MGPISEKECGLVDARQAIPGRWGIWEVNDLQTGTGAWEQMKSASDMGV